MACYNRAALEYLKVRLEAIPRDILALNPEALERIEMGLGQSILVQRATAQRRALRDDHRIRQLVSRRSRGSGMNLRFASSGREVRLKGRSPSLRKAATAP